MKLKVIHALNRIFGITIVICLIVGFLTALGFCIALLVGGELSMILCNLIQLYVIPTLYVSGASTTFIGLLKMYLAGEKTFVMEKFQRNTK